MKIYDLLKRGAAISRESIAVTHGDRQITYRELLSNAENLAAFLKTSDIPPKARAAILFENSIEYVISFFAACLAGYIVVPLETSLRPEKINLILKESGARILLAQAKFQKQILPLFENNSPVEMIIADRIFDCQGNGIKIESLQNILERKSGTEKSDTEEDCPGNAELKYADLPECSNELAAIFYTSGSTGLPKGVMLSHLNLISNTVATVEYLKLTASDSIMVVLPFHYIYGNSLLLTHIAAGGRVVIDNRFAFQQAVLETMMSEKVSGFSGVPSNFIGMLSNKNFCSEKLPNLRYLTQAGGGMAPEIIKKVMVHFPDKEIFIMYGQTEASPRISYLPPEMLHDKVGSIGIPVPGVTIKLAGENGDEVPIGEAGEILVRGDNVMMGYWNQPDEEKEVLRDGWLYTGDLARRDPEGFIYIISRRKEIIKVGGIRVSAKEVEDCLLENEMVREVAVIGVRDDILGEAIKAVIVPAGDNGCNVETIQKYCLARMARHKLPKYIEFVTELPKFQSGKVNKLSLKTD